MNHCMKLLVVALSLVFGAGCGGFKETFEYRTAASARPTAKASCKTPLRVAVKPYRDARKASEKGTDSFVLSMLAGPVVATPAKSETSFDQEKVRATRPIYVHDDRRMYAITLWAELTESGCFEEVAFEPLDESQYDLVFTGEIQRFGIMRSTGFVPLPLYFGNLIASAGLTQQALVEVDLYAYRPDSPDPVLRYGLQGYCDDECSEDNWIDSVVKSLRSGHEDFIARLSSYLASRGNGYWSEYVAHRHAEKRRALDPDLARLERARTNAPALARKYAALDAIIDRGERLERRWAATSRERVHAEVIASNELVDAVHAQRVRAAILAGALSTATAGAGAAAGGDSKDLVPTAANVQRFQKDMQAYQQALLALGEKPSARAELSPKTAAEIASIRRAKQSLATEQKKLLAAYRAETESVDSLLDPAPSPTVEPATEQPTKSASNRRPKAKSAADELGY